MYALKFTGDSDRDEVNENWTYPTHEANYPYRQHPEQYKVATGDRSLLSCQIENLNRRTSWRRQDGLPLPSSARLHGGDLIIEYTQKDAAGVYECLVHEAQGEIPIVTAELVVVGMLLENKKLNMKIS